MRRLPLLLLVLFGALALSYPLSDTDLWWHLAAGRALVEHGTWLRNDPFCTSSLGTPWTDLHWGFQLLVLAVHRLGSEFGLVLLRISLVLAAAWIALRQRLAWDTVAMGVLLLFASRLFLDLRPLLVTLLCLACLWTLLETELRPRQFLTAIALQIVLANTQGLFLLGPLFVAASSVGAFIEGRRHAGMHRFYLGLVLLGASLINPWGIHAFDLARLVAGRITPGAANLFSREIPENLPLLDWLREDPARGLPWAWALLGTLALWRRGEGALGRALLLTGSVALAFMAVRNLPLAALAMLFSVAPSKWRSGTVPFVLSFLLAAGLAVPLLRERRWDLPGSWSAPFGTPSDSALEAIAKIPGPVFHELRVGGWLSWKLENRKACWADTRLVLHDAAFVHAYLDVLDNPEHFEAWSRLQGFQAALLPVASWPRDRGLVATLLSSPDWKLVECDGAWILFARRETDFASLDVGTAGGRAVIDLALHDRFASNPRLEAFARTQWNQTLRLAGLSR